MKKKTKISPENKRFYDAVKRAMPVAARRAREIAKMHGTMICIWEDGKVVLKKP